MMTPTARSRCGFVDAAIYSSAKGIADIAETQTYSRKAGRLIAANENRSRKRSRKDREQTNIPTREYFGLTRE